VRSRSVAVAAASLLLLVLPSAAAAAPRHAVASCATGALALRVAPGGAAAGSTYHRLELTNRSPRGCSLFGYPGVSAVSSHGAQIGSPARRNPQHPSRLVVLRPGATATAIVQVVDTHNFPPAVCRARAAVGLRVYPPGAYASKVVPFRLSVCSTARASLSVEAVT
jgi:hypothetical protein